MGVPHLVARGVAPSHLAGDRRRPSRLRLYAILTLACGAVAGIAAAIAIVPAIATSGSTDSVLPAADLFTPPPPIHRTIDVFDPAPPAPAPRAAAPAPAVRAPAPAPIPTAVPRARETPEPPEPGGGTDN